MMPLSRRRRVVIFAAFLVCSVALPAENGADGWLRYAPIQNQVTLRQYAPLPGKIVALGSSVIVHTAETESVRGLQSMLGRTIQVESSLPAEDSFVLGTIAQLQPQFPGWHPPALKAEGFSLATVHEHGHTYWLVAGADDRGVLYGAFRLLEYIAEQRDPASFRDSESPSAPVRWVNQWDNFDGSIERGFAGRSIFFDNGSVRPDLTRVSEYGRLLASVGINSCTINNVNADLRTLTPEMIRQIARVAEAFRPWGVRLSLSVDLSSPKVVGGLSTFDPLDPQVIEWWKKKTDEVYAEIPDFAGFVIKADSEGRPGPSQYGRTPMDAANLLARALKPHGGVVLYRAFVYDHHLDWHNLKADRARAAYDIFHPLDGKFDDNVIVQIKNGPIDFQVREPVSPLFAGLRHTNEAIELQVTQEYTGQQHHLVFLVPMWKEALDFDLRADNRSTPVKQIVEGHSFGRPTGGFVAVVDVGLDTNWLRHPLAMANLYGYARLAWNPDTSPQAIAEDWTRMTFGNNPVVVRTIDSMLLSSWRIYEQYTGPLGIGTLTDIIHAHYGPGVESAERNGWGQWFRADHEGVGMDRTVSTGTGYIGQYPPQVAGIYESLETCPDSLLLFMHHVPYTHHLHSGDTVIQYIYDSHYDGVDGARTLLSEWQSLRGLVDNERYETVLALQQYQVGHAIVWRDAVTKWFNRMSGVPDARGRVGNYPNRIEAESMRLDGYSPVDVTPWETASGGKAVVCQGRDSCSASTTLNRPAGTYDISVQYFDERNGSSKYQLLLNGRAIGQWSGDNNTFPSDRLDGHTSTRFTLHGIALKPGDVLAIEGHPEGGEPAPLDYVSISPQSAGGSKSAGGQP
ncbi:MAG TPA: alpha-glucuronidase family glycosyl hydrolase [Acidobacteriaceae bacterium]|nr:alpha-glucuronidase family glycosyl hydrolase [Acidobacteriaceae bacterium]